MIPPLMNWFQQPSENGKDNNLRYLATLIFLNHGNTEVTGVSHTPANNQFGRLGLQPVEAVHLMKMWSFVRGILFVVGSPELEHDVQEFVGREIHQVATNSSILIPTGAEVSRFGK